MCEVSHLCLCSGAKQDSFKKWQTNVKEYTTPVNNRFNQHQQPHQPQQHRLPHATTITMMMMMMIPTIKSKLTNRGIIGIVRK